VIEEPTGNPVGALTARLMGTRGRAGRDNSRALAEAERVASYAERLRTPWWWYLGALGVAVLLGAEFAFAVSGWITWVPLLVLVPVCLFVVWRMSAARVVVSGGRLLVPGNEIAVTGIEQVIPLSATELRRLVGRHSNPTSFVYIRSWVGPGLQLVLDQSAEDGTATSAGDYPVPYWVVSTRRPAELAAALVQAR
jgi:Protein of unknown function (DUF3093)